MGLLLLVYFTVDTVHGKKEQQQGRTASLASEC
jgi:hypothetical protein